MTGLVFDWTGLDAVKQVNLFYILLSKAIELKAVQLDISHKVTLSLEKKVSFLWYVSLILFCPKSKQKWPSASCRVPSGFP